MQQAKNASTKMHADCRDEPPPRGRILAYLGYVTLTREACRNNLPRGYRIRHRRHLLPKYLI